MRTTPGLSVASPHSNLSQSAGRGLPSARLKPSEKKGAPIWSVQGYKNLTNTQSSDSTTGTRQSASITKAATRAAMIQYQNPAVHE